MAERYPEKLVLLAISSDLDKADILRFTGKIDSEYGDILKQDNVLLVHDENAQITFGVFQTTKLPESIIVSPEQEMVKKFIGANWSMEDIGVFIKD